VQLIEADACVYLQLTVKKQAADVGGRGNAYEITMNSSVEESDDGTA
jgi:hypothetical protein